MKKKDYNFLKDNFSELHYYWNYQRKPEFHVPKAIYDTITALYHGDMKPIIVERNQLDNGWWFLVSLPPGEAYLKFKGYEQLFAESCGGSVHIERKGKAVHLWAYEAELQTKYPYLKHIKNADCDGMYLPCHFGISATGAVIYDLSDMEGVLIGGNRGMGKTTLLLGLATTLCTTDNVALGVIDLKRVDFVPFKEHCACAFDITKADKMLKAINAEIDRRMKVFEEHKVNKLPKLLKKGIKMPWCVLIIDELTEIQDSDVMARINRVLRLGRAFGVYVIAATQRPSSTALKNWGDSKMLLPARVCFSVPDVINSQVILDNDRGAALPIMHGRCIFQYKKTMEVQSLFLEPEEAEEILSKSMVKSEVINYESPSLARLPEKGENRRINPKTYNLEHGADYIPFLSGPKK